MSGISRRKGVQLIMLCVLGMLSGCAKYETRGQTAFPNNPSPESTPSPQQTRKPVENISGSENTQFQHPQKIENELHRFTNKARTTRQRAPLQWSDPLSKIARHHSYDMAIRDYYGHINPDGQHPQDRIEEYHLPFDPIGENLAKSGTSTIDNYPELSNRIFSMWKTSDSHWKNILRRTFTHEGIGVYFPEQGGIRVTQIFGHINS